MLLISFTQNVCVCVCVCVCVEGGGEVGQGPREHKRLLCAMHIV